MGEVLARAEGVSVQRAGGLGSNMRFSLNGLTNDQIRFFVNGVPLEFSPYSLGLANIPVNFVNRMEIYKGVLPIQFGADALGGGVNVVTNPVKPGLHGDLSYQYGSFKTHRTTMSISYGKKNFFLILTDSMIILQIIIKWMFKCPINPGNLKMLQSDVFMTIIRHMDPM